MNAAWFLFSLEGRLSRQAYWLFTGSSIVLSLLVFYSMGAGEHSSKIVAVISLVMIWPSFAVQVKRWHDRDKSGWWVLMNFIPVIGPIWVLIENGILSGTSGENRFGACSNVAPKAVEHDF